jgi:hypothetical protein
VKVERATRYLVVVEGADDLGTSKIDAMAEAEIATNVSADRE